MDQLLAARVQMAFSLGVHMLFAATGVGLPLLMLLAEGLWLRSRAPHLLTLARTWSKVTGLLFALGAVSGTVLTFELGLLWPRFMAVAGSAVAPAFTLEGVFFFLEAIFLALYVYGWERLRPVAHWLCGVVVAVSGAVSSALVVAADAYMQHPVDLGVLLHDPAAFRPLAIFANPAWGVMAVHSTLATYVATSFAVAGVYAAAALRGHGDRLRKSAIALCMAVGTLAALAMPLTGDTSGKAVARLQPVKLAAMEGQFRTESAAPLRIGGWPEPARGVTPYALTIPGGLSYLAYGNWHATVTGLDAVPRSRWPNVTVTHVAFQIMVAAGLALLLAAAAYWLDRLRPRARGAAGPSPPVLRLLLLASPLGFLALEAGWVVTEVGRQPWIIYGVMRTAQAVTPRGGVVATFVLFLALYALLLATMLWVLRHLRHA